MTGAGKRTLVVGGGLIGTEVALRLRESGGDVRVLSRTIGSRLRALAPAAGIELVEAELGTGLKLSSAIADVDAIVCLAGSSTPSRAAADPAGALSGSVMPALDALLAAADAGVKRVVVASSGGTIYGAGAPRPTPEDAPRHPSSLHGVNSLALEEYVEFFRRESGIGVTVLRFSNVYGPGAEPRRGQGVIAAWVRALALGQRVQLIGSEEAERDFVYVADAADAVERVLGAEPGTFNVGGGGTVSLATLLEHLREGTGIDPVVDRQPARGVDVPSTHLDVSRIREVAGWEPTTSLSDGIAATWAWETRERTR